MQISWSSWTLHIGRIATRFRRARRIDLRSYTLRLRLSQRRLHGKTSWTGATCTAIHSTMEVSLVKCTFQWRIQHSPRRRDAHSTFYQNFPESPGIQQKISPPESATVLGTTAMQENKACNDVEQHKITKQRGTTSCTKRKSIISVFQTQLAWPTIPSQ